MLKRLSPLPVYAVVVPAGFLPRGARPDQPGGEHHEAEPDHPAEKALGHRAAAPDREAAPVILALAEGEDVGGDLADVFGRVLLAGEHRHAAGADPHRLGDRPAVDRQQRRRIVPAADGGAGAVDAVTGGAVLLVQLPALAEGLLIVGD